MSGSVIFYDFDLNVFDLKSNVFDLKSINVFDLKSKDSLKLFYYVKK